LTALLLDLGNVLVRFDHAVTLRRIEAATGVPAERLGPVLFGPLERAFDLGHLTAGEFFRAAEREAGLSPLPDEVWIPAWRDIFEPVPETAAVLAALLPGVRTCVVSNTNALHWDGVRRVSDVDRRVDALALSFEVGALKPDAALWHAALRRLDASPEGAVFADDRPELVAAAREIGLDAFTVDGPGALARELTRRGLMTADAEPSFALARSLLFVRGVEEFRADRFFEAHEEWEILWKETDGPDRIYLQGLIQLAAGCVHLVNGRPAPGLRLLGLALVKLEKFPACYGGLPVAGLRRDIREALSAPPSFTGPARVREAFRL
jgi:glucose-1-phosphatase